MQVLPFVADEKEFALKGGTGLCGHFYINTR
jgi:hypothetical protein